MATVTIPNPPPFDIINQAALAGHFIHWEDGQYFSDDQAQAWINSYNALPVAIAAKVAELAAYRYAQEISGTNVGGIPVQTDDRSKLLITGKRVQAIESPNGTWNWKTGPGTSATLTAAQVIAVADGVAAFVQGCFDREIAIAAQISAMTDWTAVASIDIAAAWSSSTVT